MSLIRWEPERELSSLQQEVNRLFSTFFDAPAPGKRGATANRWVPAMDLVEEDQHFLLRADLPGMEEDDVDIELEGNVLTISGERKQENSEEEKGYYRVERAIGAFNRSLTLPDGVDADAIDAVFDKGVLELRIPKPEQRRARRVRIETKRREAIEA